MRIGRGTRGGKKEKRWRGGGGDENMWRGVEVRKIGGEDEGKRALEE